jgi:hypothetical protein
MFGCAGDLYSGVLSIMYAALVVYFLLLINRHRQSAVGTHYFLLAVLLLATGTSGGFFFVIVGTRLNEAELVGTFESNVRRVGGVVRHVQGSE